jgi:hypothetical protein
MIALLAWIAYTQSVVYRGMPVPVTIENDLLKPVPVQGSFGRTVNVEGAFGSPVSRNPQCARESRNRVSADSSRDEPLDRLEAVESESSAARGGKRPQRFSLRSPTRAIRNAGVRSSG